MENITAIISSILGSGIVSTALTYFTTKKRYITEIEQLRTDNFAKVVDKYQDIIDDLQVRYETSEKRYIELVDKYNCLMDVNLKLQSEIQTLKIQIRKLQKNEEL